MDRPGRPSTTEDEYFVREDAEKKRKLALEQKKATELAEQQRLRELHHMRCPKCGMELQEVHMRGVDVDVCFSCNGVFFDAGELEKLEKPEAKGVMSAVIGWFKPELKKPT